MQNQRNPLPSMLALPRRLEQARADYSLITAYDTICMAQSQYCRTVGLFSTKKRAIIGYQQNRAGRFYRRRQEGK